MPRWRRTFVMVCTWSTRAGIPVSVILQNTWNNKQQFHYGGQYQYCMKTINYAHYDNIEPEQGRLLRVCPRVLETPWNYSRTLWGCWLYVWVHHHHHHHQHHRHHHLRCHHQLQLPDTTAASFATYTAHNLDTTETIFLLYPLNSYGYCHHCII